ncbi:Mitochondrial chaperone Frataxin [Loxospora ochrophaea]|nr:Mitochondrial chaperone Frataxin [Loxospora ochrophaea]
MFIRRSSHDAGLLMRLRKSYSDSFTSPHFKPTKPFPQASTFASSAALRRTASPPLLVWFHRSLKFDTFSRPRPNNPETLKHDIKFRSAKFSSKTDPAETPNEPSDPNPASTPAKLNESEYHALADAYLNELEDKLQELVEVNPRADCEYSTGIIRLEYPPLGIYVINKQPPNRQIWLSSPIIGPMRYDYISRAMETGAGAEEKSKTTREGGFAAETEGEWISLRDGSKMTDLLVKELGIKAGFNDEKGAV